MIICVYIYIPIFFDPNMIISMLSLNNDIIRSTSGSCFNIDQIF